MFMFLKPNSGFLGMHVELNPVWLAAVQREVHLLTHEKSVCYGNRPCSPMGERTVFKSECL